MSVMTGASIYTLQLSRTIHVMHGHGHGGYAWCHGHEDGRGDDHVLSGLRDCLFLHCMLNRLPR